MSNPWGITGSWLTTGALTARTHRERKTETDSGDATSVLTSPVRERHGDADGGNTAVTNFNANLAKRRSLKPRSHRRDRTELNSTQLATVQN